MEAGRQNVRQHGQVHDLGQGLVLVRKLEQVEIGVGDHDVAGLPADPAAHVPDEVSASTEHLSARTSSKRLTSDPDVRRQDLQRPLHVCAVTRRRFPVGASPTRQPLQPEATGAVMEVTKWLKPSV